MKKQTEKLANDLIANIQATAIKTAQNQTHSNVNYFIGTVANIDETNNRALVKYMVTQQDGSTGYSNIEAAVKTEEVIKVGDTVIVFYLGNLTDSFIFGKMTSTYSSKVDDGADSLQSRLERGEVIVGKAREDILGNNITDYYQTNRLGVSLVADGTAIPADTDLDTMDYIKVGKYYCRNNSIAATLQNCPTKKAFMMEVFSPIRPTYDEETTETWVYRLRKITTFEGVVYYQEVNSGNTAGSFTFYSWYRDLTSKDVFVVESGFNSESTIWWRKWSNGFKECGGISTTESGESGNPVGTTTKVESIALPFSFSNTNYQVIANVDYGKTSSAQTSLTSGHTFFAYNKAVDSFKCGTAWGRYDGFSAYWNRPVSWYASGF